MRIGCPAPAATAAAAAPARRPVTTAALRPGPGECALLADARVCQEISPTDCILARLTLENISRHAFAGQPLLSRQTFFEKGLRPRNRSLAVRKAWPSRQYFRCIRSAGKLFPDSFQIRRAACASRIRAAAPRKSAAVRTVLVTATAAILSTCGNLFRPWIVYPLSSTRPKGKHHEQHQ